MRIRVAGLGATTVDGGSQSLPGTLKVASTTDFGSSGMLTIDGISGTCNYTKTD